MTFQPESQQTIYERIRDAIASASRITNFSPNSPEKAISDDGFAAEMRERQHEQLAVQLSNRIDWAGKTLTEDDLEEIVEDPETVDLELLNSFMDENDLDEVAKRNSVERDPGAFATGEVTFTTTSEAVTVPGGTVVGTEPDSTGEYMSFVTSEDVTPDAGETTVTTSVTAEERGTDHNVGIGSIEYLPSPPSGVAAVTNESPTGGGEDEETTEELRERAKRVLINNSGGGTVGGIEGGLISRFDGLTQNDVLIEEYFDPDSSEGDRQDSPYIDAVVEGGDNDENIEIALDELRPAAIRAYLIRPSRVQVDITLSVEGSNIDTSDIEDEIHQYVSGRGIGEDLIRDQIIYSVFRAEEGVDNIEDLTVKVINEFHSYYEDADNHPVYKLNKGDAMAAPGSKNGNGITHVIDGDDNTYEAGVDYGHAIVDGSSVDAIDWGIGGSAPDLPGTFIADYDIQEDLPIDNLEISHINSATVTVI